MPGLAKPAQRLPMLALYFIFNYFAPENVRSSSYPGIINTYKADFDPPSIPSLAAHLVTGQDPHWSLPEMEALHAKYFRERHHADALALGRILEAAFSLRLAEQNRAAGNPDRARELIALAVEACPKYKVLQDFESSLTSERLPEIRWRAILLPGAFVTGPSGQEDTGSTSP